MSRTYLETHPWITFELKLAKLPAEAWMLLGEARSKCDHVGSVPLKPELAEILYGIYLAKGAQATTAIEGNTLTEDQVASHIKGELDLPQSKEYLRKEVDNIIKQANDIWSNVREETSEVAAQVTLEEIEGFNEAALDGLEVEDHVVPGRIRESVPVGVPGYRGPPAEDCRYLVEKLCDWLNNQWQLDRHQDSLGVIPAILKGIVAHLYLAWIHPFGDGNGRTARLLEFKILVSGGVPTVAAHLLSNFYNETRTKYYRELDKASKSGGDVVPFVLYALNGFVDQLVEQIRFIRTQQFFVSWKNYVYERFEGEKSRTKKRQRDLVLALTEKFEPVGLDKIAALTTDLALAYGKLSLRTLVRDLGTLQNMGLVRVNDSREYEPNLARLLEHLPERRREVPNRYMTRAD